MAMLSPVTDWTVEMVHALPEDGQRYQRERVPEYWILDLDARLVSRWRPDDTRPEELDQMLEWQPEPAVAPLTIDLPALFAAMLEG